MNEFLGVIKKLKTGKAAGPDGIPMEYLKAMDQGNAREVLDLINKWYDAGEIPNEVLMAQVVLIFKKGDTADQNAGCFIARYSWRRHMAYVRTDSWTRLDRGIF